MISVGRQLAASINDTFQLVDAQQRDWPCSVITTLLLTFSSMDDKFYRSTLHAMHGLLALL